MKKVKLFEQFIAEKKTKEDYKDIIDDLESKIWEIENTEAYWIPDTPAKKNKMIQTYQKRIDAAKKALSKLDESAINEARSPKTLTREELMDLLETKYKIKTVRTSEEFNGQTEGIWVAGDNEEELSGNTIFDYYNRSAKYANGILKQVKTSVEKTGWRFEWNDPGTIMIWPNN